MKKLDDGVRLTEIIDVNRLQVHPSFRSSPPDLPSPSSGSGVRDPAGAFTAGAMRFSVFTELSQPG